MYGALMRAVLEAVEWTYKYLKQMWSSTDFTRKLKIRKCPISLLSKDAGPN